MSPHHEKAGAPSGAPRRIGRHMGRHIVFELAYMSSQTLWAKATGSAGRMPSTSSA